MNIVLHERDPEGTGNGTNSPQDPALYLNLSTVQMESKFKNKKKIIFFCWDLFSSYFL